MSAINIAEIYSTFASSLKFHDIPHDVVTQAKYLILDSVGIAWASTHFDFAQRAISCLSSPDARESQLPVIGSHHTASLQDAMLLDGVLIHGLDYDDTHTGGVIHTTSSQFANALNVAAHADLSGEDLITAYILGTEVSARLGMAVDGAFHQVGFHPTGLLGAFGSSLASGYLLSLSASQLHHAQGIVLSFASGSLQFLDDGAWTKRLHPGWAAVSGYTAAKLARSGFIGPKCPYTGRFGLYNSYLGSHSDSVTPAKAHHALGEVWELLNIAVKPYPACHFTHASIDAAITLSTTHNIDCNNIDSVTVILPKEVIQTVCEPTATKRAPQNTYDAQFSIPYTVATALLHRAFSLHSLQPSFLRDSTLLELANKVTYKIDEDSPFPLSYSGEVVISMKDGRTYSKREVINRGSSQRPLTETDITTKFSSNIDLVSNARQANKIKNAVMSLDKLSARQLLTSLSR